MKGQVAQSLKQKRMADIQASILSEIKAKVPVTLADDYRPAGE